VCCGLAAPCGLARGSPGAVGQAREPDRLGDSPSPRNWSPPAAGRPGGGTTGGPGSSGPVARPGMSGGARDQPGLGELGTSPVVASLGQGLTAPGVLGRVGESSQGQ